MFSPFNRNQPAKLAARETRTAIEEARVAIAALQKLLTELPEQDDLASGGGQCYDRRHEEIPPKTEELIDIGVAKLTVLKDRSIRHLENKETIGKLEAALEKAQSKSHRVVADIDDEIVSAKVIDCNIRSRLDELRRDLKVAQRELDSV